MVRATAIAMLALAALLPGCASLTSPTMQPGPDQASPMPEATTAFGTAVQSAASEMVAAMLAASQVEQLDAQHRPVLFVARTRNNSGRPIADTLITETLRIRLVRSGRFHLVGSSRVRQARRQLASGGPETGMVDQATALQIGRQVGADYLLYGNLSSVVRRYSATRDLYDRFTLKLLDVGTGLVVWSEERPIVVPEAGRRHRLR